MSLSRPDPSSPTSIADASFGTSRRGFDQAEVRDFLRMVAAEFGRLRERERFLERELHAAQDGGGAGHVDEAMMTQLLGEEAVRVLTTARESANEIRSKAEQAAAQLLSEASDEAARVREEADIEASRRRADAAADAESELSMAKQQGREMVNEARAYRERVLSELARRRELAREQIEQLIHGRDRLMQAFERARLVAVDVVAEMQPLGEPNEYVNLAPTTGPLPVMIANSPRPDESDIPARAAIAAAPAGEATDETSGLRIVADDDTGAGDAVDATTADDAAIDDEVVDEATDAGDAGDGADDDVSDAGDEANHDVATDDTSDAAAVDDEATDDVATDDEANDDVANDAADADSGADAEVVDLFARLRAETADAEVVDAAATDEAGSVDAEHDVAGIHELEDDSDDEFESTPFEARDEVITPLIVSSARKLKRALADEQNDVLDALRRSESVHSIDALLPWASEHATRYLDAVADDLLDAVHAGSATSTKRKIRKALATEATDVAGEVLTKWLVLPLRDRLARCISEGEGDNAVVTKKVRAVYREWKTQRIDETLDDVMRCAHGRGVLAGFDLDTPIVWEIDTRFSACPDCEDNALAGAVAAGAQFPTGDTFAPAHPGCRCLLVAADR